MTTINDSDDLADSPPKPCPSAIPPAPRMDPSLRTIRITNIPSHLSIHDILHQLPFGPVTEVKPTTLSPSRYLLVSFLSPLSATTSITTSTQRLATLSSLQGHAYTFLICPEPLPSAPLDPILSSLIFSGALSRVLRLTHVPPHLSHPAIAALLAAPCTKWHALLAIETLTTTTLRLHCSSVKAAVRCWARARRVTALRGCSVDFEADPALGLEGAESMAPQTKERFELWMAQELGDEYWRSRTRRADFAGVPRGPRCPRGQGDVHAWTEFVRGQGAVLDDEGGRAEGESFALPEDLRRYLTCNPGLGRLEQDGTLREMRSRDGKLESGLLVEGLGMSELELTAPGASPDELSEGEIREVENIMDAE